MELSGALRATLALLLPLLCAAALREYHIAAVEIGWDYIYLDDADQTSDQRRFTDAPQKYIKAVYREYTDSTYTEPKQRPAWSGIQGPEIVAQVGDTVVVHFKNLASQPYSISPVGISYFKQSEGAGYDDSTTGQEKEDDAVSPGGYYEYVWDISHKDGPTVSDPDCLTYTYSSQVDTVRDLNSGLIGSLLICKPSVLTQDGQRKYPGFVLLFAVFDETKSWYGEVGERMSREKFRRTKGRKEYHTINGYVNSTLPGLTMCQGRNPVFWHLIGMGTAPEIHSIRFQDHSLQILTHRKITVEMTPMTFITAEMKLHATGRFLINCQIHAHQHDGMEALFTVEKCPEPVIPPVPDLRRVKHKEESQYNDNDSYEYEFNPITLQHNKPQVHARASRGQHPNTWEHYIAAEEVTWDYTPHLTPTDSEMQSRYLPRNPHHLDYTFKKVAYVEYTDGSFTQRKNSDKTLLGPILKGEVDDQLHITFRNLASRPFNIYPNGLTKIYSLHGSSKEEDLRSMGVPPNGTFRYIWKLTPDDGPLEADPTCLTHLYQSTISPERDLASGLVGTLLICKSKAIDMRGQLLGPDKKLSLIFAVFDENRSWYFNENMQQSSQNSSSINDPEFYDSNVIYSVNGVMFRKREFVVCKSDVLFWHVASVGTQSDFLSVYFTGNLFQYDGLYRSVLTLFPMTGVTVSMETEVLGEWEISAFDNNLKNRGMSIRYTVLPCNSGELPLVDHDETLDYPNYRDDMDSHARSFGPRNRTMFVKVCTKDPTNNTQSVNSSGHNVTEGRRTCRLEKVTAPSVQPTDEEIPLDVLEKIEREEELMVPQNQSEHGEHNGGRQRRHTDGNSTDGNMTSGASGSGGITAEITGGVAQKLMDGNTTSGAFGSGRTTADIVGEVAQKKTDGNTTSGAFRSGRTTTEIAEVAQKLTDGITTSGAFGSGRTIADIVGEVAENLTDGNTTSGAFGSGGITENIVGEVAENLTDGNTTSGAFGSGGITAEIVGEIGKNMTDGDMSSGASGSGEITAEIVGQVAENLTDAMLTIEGQSEVWRGKNKTSGEQEENNEIPINQEALPSKQVSALGNNTSEEMEQNLVTQNYIQPEPDQIMNKLLEYNSTSSNESTAVDLSLEYDDYSGEGNTSSDLFATDYLNMRSGEIRPRYYYIAAEEIVWDYGIRTPHQLIKPREMRRGMRKFLPKYKKVVFRGYVDKDFRRPVGRGELQEHLGILGPVIRTEINDLLTVTFKNNAFRPYSFNLQGVYDKIQYATFAQTSSSSAPPGVPGDPVPPGETRTYNWRITHKQGPTDSEFDCKTGAYYSTVDKEKDLHSGLIGPLVICKSGTLHYRLNTQPDIQEFSLLFHTFDETKSWYMEENLQQYCAPPCQANTEDQWYHTSNTFAAINGYVAETLPGLLLAQHQLVRWHLLNVGSDKEFHAVHFHGLPFTVRAKKPHRMGVYSLFPGVFGTVEMRPPTVGTWLVECIIGDYQLAGMRATLLVYNPRCSIPLGMKSGRIEDYQITASDHIENWEPSLARLEQSGYINAWMGTNKKSWLQVDLLKPTLLHGVLTQGVSSKLRNHYITLFNVLYSLDQESWTTYRGNSTLRVYNFHGNLDSSKVKDNRFSAPFVARYIRIHPVSYELKPALRLELLGCDLNSCSLPLGLQRRLINDSSLTASSHYSYLLRSWSPSLARLHQKGRANAWRPKNNNPHEWLQVDLGRMSRITGVITQGAQSLFTKLMVTEFSVTFSHDKHSWSSVLEEDSQREKIFQGNSNSENEDEEALTVFDPPLFGRFLRIHPRGWINGIALRLEVLGCDTLQVV